MSSVFTKHRFEIWNQAQHPYLHTLSDFTYTNPAIPGSSSVEDALDWLFAVLYPNTKPAVANVAALPLVGNTLNDYRVVLDDGDGNQAGYRWEQREGEATPSWHKIFDFDWSSDSILAALTDITQYLYVVQNGKQDLDASGAVVTGLYAGQTIFGGTQANQNLTFRANSGDGVGPHTGYVQVDDNFRPTVNNTYDLGTATEAFKNGYLAGILAVGTMSIASGSITDSSGAISFGNENLSTTGTMTANQGYFVASVEVGPLAGNALVLAPGSITDESGAISFGNENLSTTGTITAAANSILADITFAAGSITSASPTISFGSNNLSTTGTLGAGDSSLGLTTVTRLDADNIRLDGNTISITNLNGNLNLLANGTGVIDLQSSATTLGITATGTVSVTGQLNADNIRLDGNTISSTDVNGNLILDPNGTGVIEAGSSILPSTDASFALGSTTNRFTNLFMSGSLGDGTSSITIGTILSLSNINAGVATGMALFYNSISGKWEPSYPDTEVTHSGLSGLTTGDAGHTQFAMLTGRAGGQTLQGGTAASENLILESTSNATKGSIQTKDNFVPFTNASYSGSWSGTDLGGSSNYFRDIYTKGEAKGFRVENYTVGTLPASSAQNVGRLLYATDTGDVYVDTGSALKQVGNVNKYLSDTVWNGSDTTKTITVSSTIVDAREAIWALHDNANDFERMYVTIKAISATQVRVDVNPALPAGSYRLIGIE